MEKNDKRALLETVQKFCDELGLTYRVLPEVSALDYSEADLIILDKEMNLTEEQAKAILYGDGRIDMQTIGTDQFITKENEGGF